MPQGVWILLLLRLPGLIASLTATDPVFRRPRNADNKPRGKWGKGEKGRCVFPNLRLLPTLQSLFPYRSLSSRAGKVEGIRLPTLMTFSTRYKLCLSLLHLLLSLSPLSPFTLPPVSSPSFSRCFLLRFFFSDAAGRPRVNEQSLLRRKVKIVFLRRSVPSELERTWPPCCSSYFLFSRPRLSVQVVASFITNM